MAKNDTKKMQLTQQGVDELKAELQELQEEKLPKVIKRVAEARSHGDLKENSEYKFAQERRFRLQSELKMLSEQISRARILTVDDIVSGEVGIGTVVDLMNSNGNKVTYTILGPWDANPDENVLSFQSKLAQEMMGRKQGDEFSFRDEKYQVAAIRSYL